MNEFDDALLAEWQNDGKQVQHAADWYERVQQMRKRADYYERALIRHLHFEQGLTWREVAEIVNANLTSRQAAQQKWRRLVADERRTPGGPVRGSWPKGRPRR